MTKLRAVITPSGAGTRGNLSKCKHGPTRQTNKTVMV